MPYLTPEAAFDRFMDKVEMTGTCWNWTGYQQRGYGVVCRGRKRLRAHRYAYELLVGPIPKGLTLDHLCRNTICVNPDHLEPVTAVENVMRGESFSAIQARRTHCPKGHEYTPENTYLDARGHRICRTCSRNRRYQFFLRNRERLHEYYRLRRKGKEIPLWEICQ